MEYPWQHHHPPPPLHPPPPTPPPPPGNPANLCPTCSFSHFPFCPFPQQFPNPNFHQLHNHTPNFESHYGSPNFESHYRSPNFESHYQSPNFQLHNESPNFQLHNQSPNFQLHKQRPNFQLHNQSPNFQLHNQMPNLQSHDQNHSFQLHDHNPNFQLHNQRPNLQSHDQNPSFQLHDHNPSFQSHEKNPSFQLHDQNPKFQLQNQSLNLQSHDQNPSFQLHDRSPNFRSHDQNPSIHLHDRSPNFQSHDQNPSFQLHDHNPNFQFHNQRPSFLSHDQNPSFPLHDQHPSFRSRDQNPIFQPFERSPSFLSQDQSLSFRPPAGYSLQNPQIEQVRNPGTDYSPFDHGYKRPRNGELGVDDDERRLKLIRDHGVKDSNLVNGEIREHFHGDSGLKRPRFDESGVGKKYTTSNLNTHYKIDSENELGRRGYGEEPSLRTNFRDNYEQRQARDDIYPKSYGVRSNIPPTHDTRSRVHSNESAFVNHVSPTSLQVSPQNRTSFDNTNVGIARGVNGPTTLLMDPKGPLLPDQLTPSSQSKTSSLFPISVAASAPIALSYDPFSEAQNTEFQSASQRLSMNYQREGQRFPLIPSNKPKAVDASHIFKQPHRASRPDRIVVILRGLPGSGKSYLAKIMRDLEVDNGGNAPRIHSMDDYFMTEVEKVEEGDNSKSSGSSRGKKPLVKMVMEYCYEAEMEEAYRSSMLKTFKKTLDEGAFPFVIVDDRNLRVADFAQFWATAKRSGYEVYLLEPTYKDPAGCAARNVHGFTLDDIQKMAYQWEEAPSMYLKLEAKSLLQGDDSKENAIQEVDMDTGDGGSEDALNGSAEENTDISAPSTKNLSPSGPFKAEDSWNVESDHLREEVKELGRSKWSNDLEDDDGQNTEANKKIPNALSAMVKAYKREGKSVHWGDQAANTGFSIGAAKRVNTSLEIGPGSGYNSKSNPLPEDLVAPCNNGKLKTQHVFQERIRAERESFRAVFDRRRHRIGGLDSDEE